MTAAIIKNKNSFVTLDNDGLALGGIDILFKDLSFFDCLVGIYQAEAGLGIGCLISQFSVGRGLPKNAADSLHQSPWIMFEGLPFFRFHG